MPNATMTSKGQITIPKEIRELLNLHAGDRVDFLMLPDGVVALRAATIDISELEGILKQKNRQPVSLVEMDRAIRERIRK